MHQLFSLTFPFPVRLTSPFLVGCVVHAWLSTYLLHSALSARACRWMCPPMLYILSLVYCAPASRVYMYILYRVVLDTVVSLSTQYTEESTTSKDPQDSFHIINLSSKTCYLRCLINSLRSNNACHSCFFRGGTRLYACMLIYIGTWDALYLRNEKPSAAQAPGCDVQALGSSKQQII